MAFVVTFATIRVMLRNGISHMVLDQPNHRSLHTQPIPRLGGLAVMIGTFAGWSVGIAGVHVALILMLLALGGVSFLDDLFGLAVRWRFLTHFLVAIVFVWMSAPHELGWWVWPCLVLGIVWMTNLFNFMDGSDGLAGGMALFGFGSYSLAAWLSGESVLALLSGAVAFANLAFLCFNFHPARIFMGDAGSIPLGFLSAGLGIMGWAKGLWPAWFPLVVFSPFVADATVTLLKRLLRGERVWEAHREHYYQRLVQMGYGHRRTAIAEYALMMVVSGAAIWALNQLPAVQVAFCLGCGLAYFLLMKQIDRFWAAHLLRQHDEN